MVPKRDKLMSYYFQQYSANWLSIVENNKTLIYLSLVPCIYITIYGIYLVIGPVDLYEDGSKNFFLKNPYESELPPQFLLLKLYQYILIGVGVIFGYLFLKYLKNYGR